ncbi:MAG: asparagine synthase (glutamine-hydrolyzing) [Lachnospiraceae bacterium]|nr:asparagine synthase (glutamine-hydrolyzing) [Lachnospiraceae bacterium]
MCGICGFFSKQNITHEDLIRMNDTMVHRGPDDSGAEIYAARGGYTVGLAQRRLSIRDLSSLGHQPMHAATEQLVVVFNGEIYNAEELKKELVSYPFRSTCDTEVILAAYLEWGDDFVSHLSGMFAIALLDRVQETLILARDRIGKKPLYYWEENGELVFASTMAPIMEFPGFRREIDRRVLPRYLYHQYIPAPESIFKNVRRLRAGEMITIRLGAGGLIRESRKYWDIADRYQALSAAPVADYEEAKEQLREYLKLAVADRMVADVPVGLFLSGGYDSSLITAIAQELSPEPVRTFSVGFSDPAFDESKCAEAVARHLGTRHTTRIIEESDMLALVEDLPATYDEPFADPSEIPTMLVSQTARQDVTVALSGDGGDEFFCGYAIYDRVALARRLDGAGMAAHLLGKLPLGGGKTLAQRYSPSIRAVAENRDPLTKTQIASRAYLDTAASFIGGDREGERRHTLLSDTLPILYPQEDRYPARDWQVIRMLLDMDTYLPDDILCKVDRASMKYSLEARCPILDTRVMEYSFRLPHAFKYRAGEKKAILKDIAYTYIPKDLLDRPKQGFTPPIDKWLRGPLQKELLEYANVRFLQKQGLFDPEFVTKYVTDYILKGDGGAGTGENPSGIVWSFFVFQRWFRRYKERT